MAHSSSPSSAPVSDHPSAAADAFDYSRLEARWAERRRASAELSNQLLKHIEREGATIFRRYRAARAIVFGSLVEGRADARSDIDLVVLGTDPSDYWALRRDLEETFERPIDLHTESDDPRFVSKAIERGRLIYAAQPRTTARRHRG